ncbi:DUF2752 domain-containing protein [Dinghuibacter silviterrae]|uniref:Uncharacterized protein DUF2752 n=1 Tax=Dinghuibacter silviterrae TaxID=1539049 RepID=A0A4V6Q9V3_9BACT|nr:DUF2752 domain-containing protein [Dinghuibacter silviterrae]TDW96452.1 uncharacterized protein DUF2752 [Dinghuibacter silviterrae]
MAWADRWSGSKRTVWALALLAAPVLVFCVDYHAGDRDLSFCLFKLMTGHPCYGCGTLRGLSAVLHLDPMAAWRLNKLNALRIPLLGALYVQALLKLVSRRKIVGAVHPLPAREIGEIHRLES